VRDAVGNPTAVSGPDGDSNYLYDADNHLLRVCYTSPCTASASISWTYDPVGNRLSESRAAGVRNYAYDAADELVTNASGGVTAHPTYDTEGNQTTGQGMSYVYNVARELTAVTDQSSGASTTYSYDGDGNRLTATTGGLTTAENWDVNNPHPRLATVAPAAGVPQDYVYGLSPLALLQQGQAHYLQTDAVGSLIRVSSASGQTESTASYEPFGSIKQSSGISTAPSVIYGYAGMLHDIKALNADAAREYNSNSGRFLSMDPAGSATGQEAATSYGYAGENPMLNWDPDGRSFTWDAVLNGVAGGLGELFKNKSLSGLGKVGGAATGAVVSAFNINDDCINHYDAMRCAFDGAGAAAAVVLVPASATVGIVAGSVISLLTPDALSDETLSRPLPKYHRSQQSGASSSNTTGAKSTGAGPRTSWAK
jgi:RHS repeat-associated protein